MKRKIIPCLLALALSASLAPSVLAAALPAGPHCEAALQADRSAADLAAACYPVSVTRSEDKTSICKVYELAPGDDPALIPRAAFERDGWRYTLTELVRKELPVRQERTCTETFTAESKTRDTEAVLALLPQTREIAAGDGFSGVLELRLDTVKVEPSGYGSATRELTARRTYPNLADQDAAYIPKSVEENGKTLTLTDVQWTAGQDGRYTALALYSGTATGSYVKSYTVTAQYSGTVSRTAVEKVRYTAMFTGTKLEPEPQPSAAPDQSAGKTAAPLWLSIALPVGAAALAIGAAVVRVRREAMERKGGGEE